MGKERGIEPIRAMRGAESCRVPPSALSPTTQRLKYLDRRLEIFC